MIRADIATLIQQGNVLLAREKAEKLIQEEGSNTVLEVVETQIGVVMERFQELEQGCVVIFLIALDCFFDAGSSEACPALLS